MAYCFTNPEMTYSMIQNETTMTSDEECEENDQMTSSNTISKYFELFRTLICEEMIEISKTRKIGGINTEVEMDESMCGKRKHNRGKLTGRHQWIFGGICRQTREIFLAICPGNKRDRPTLEKIIVEHVEAGTTLYTDGWKAYEQLERLGYKWEMVNHSEHFVSPTNPACHTNTIEGTWRCLKRWLPSSGRYSLEDYLPLYLWFNNNKKNGQNSFWQLLQILSKNMEGDCVDVAVLEVP